MLHFWQFDREKFGRKKFMKRNGKKNHFSLPQIYKMRVNATDLSQGFFLENQKNSKNIFL